MLKKRYKNTNLSLADEYFIYIHDSIAIQEMKKIIEEKCNINAKYSNIYLNSKIAKIAGNVIMYKQKNILQA